MRKSYFIYSFLKPTVQDTNQERAVLMYVFTLQPFRRTGRFTSVTLINWP